VDIFAYTTEIEPGITAIASCSTSCQNLKILKHTKTLKIHPRLESAASNCHAKAKLDELELVILREKWSNELVQ
jgi:hypothetical protein